MFVITVPADQGGFQVLPGHLGKTYNAKGRQLNIIAPNFNLIFLADPKLAATLRSSETASLRSSLYLRIFAKHCLRYALRQVGVDANAHGHLGYAHSRAVTEVSASKVKRILQTMIFGAYCFTGNMLHRHGYAV